MRCFWFCWIAALGTLLPLVSGESCSGRGDVAVGDFMVATRDLPDPNFARTVVLLIHFDGRRAMGLVINRQTTIPLARALQRLDEAKDRKDPLYIGGPVEPTGLLALLRSRTRPTETRHVFGDVYLISSTARLKKILAEGANASTFHAYIGYSGWSADQLRREIGLGLWHIVPADADMVFASEPDSVWPRLIQRAYAPLARLGAAPNGTMSTQHMQWRRDLNPE